MQCSHTLAMFCFLNHISKSNVSVRFGYVNTDISHELQKGLEVK